MSTYFRMFGSEDSRVGPNEVRTNGSGYWSTEQLTGGVVFNIDNADVVNDTRMKVVCSSETVGSNVKSKIYSNGDEKADDEVAGVLDHTNQSIYNVGHYYTDNTPGLYHSFVLYDQPLSDKQLAWLSQSNNNPAGCA